MNPFDVQVAEALEKAADLLESGTIPWHRGEYEDPDGGGAMCAVGVLCHAAEENWRRMHPVAHQAAKHIKPHVIKDVLGCFDERVLAEEKWDAESAVITFNDRVARDVSEVIEVMKLAAKDVRNQA